MRPTPEFRTLLVAPGDSARKAENAPAGPADTPSPDRVRWAEEVRDGFAAGPWTGVSALNGQTIDRPHLKLSERILAAAG